MNHVRVGVREIDQTHEVQPGGTPNAAIDVLWVEIDGERVPGDIVAVNLGQPIDVIEEDGKTYAKTGYGGLAHGIHVATITVLVSKFETVDHREREALA